MLVLTCFSAKKPPPDVNPRAVFANNEIHLGSVSVYGFDYDYTLAHYKPSLHHLIYDLGKKALVENFKVCFSMYYCAFSDNI